MDLKSAKKTWVRVKKYVRANVRVQKVPRVTIVVGAAAIFLTIGVVSAAMLMASRQLAGVEAAQGQATGKKASASQRPSAGAASATRLGAQTTANGPAAAAAAKLAPVTITGCLERHDETFRLKDTTGVDAPKARSWKSGFLKKGSASIDVVDAANRLKLTDHVGQRVSVTGVLVDREMQLRSLQRVAASCS